MMDQLHGTAIDSEIDVFADISFKIINIYMYMHSTCRHKLQINWDKNESLWLQADRHFLIAFFFLFYFCVHIQDSQTQAVSLSDTCVPNEYMIWTTYYTLMFYRTLTCISEAAVGICRLKCFCLCFCCTFKANPDPNIPCNKMKRLMFYAFVSF